MAKTINREFKALNDREHVLLRPAMYIGNPVLTKKEMWVFDRETKKFEFKEIEFVPALLKCCEEIIDNSLDIAIDTDFKTGNIIKVNVTDTSIEIIDNGTGIPVQPPVTEDPKGRWCPELAWTQMRAGTSFKDKRKGPSANGVGSTCVNIFCKIFKGTTDDGHFSQTVTCSDNMGVIEVSKPKASKGKTGTIVYMEPDLKRFKQKIITDAHKNLIYQRLLNLSISYPKITFYFNKEKISMNNRKFASLFSDDAVTVNSDNATIVVFPNPYDEFRQYSYVNGIAMARGGSQIDFTVNEIVQPIKDKLIKKYKTIRPGDIKQKLAVVVFLTDFDDPQFDAQTKESLTNSWSEVSKHYDGKIDFEAFSKSIMKSSAIMGPIIETFKIKEELKARLEIKKVKKIRISADKYMPPTGEQKLLVLCEGQSALSSISQCLGRHDIGYYALRGLPLNCYDSSLQKIAANQEVKDVLNILGLDANKNADEEQNINFEKVVIGVDADVDGSHLASMLVGWFKRFAPKLYNDGRICRLTTPVAIVRDKKTDKIVDWFFTLDQFKKWEAKNDASKVKVVYLKGLGSLDKEDLQYIIDQGGSYESLIETYKLDAESEQYIEDWLGSDSEPRKEYLRNYTFDINSI